jgi:hypothetical protein
VGWQDRDWAKWDDRERAHFLGAAPAPTRRRVAVATSELTLLAVLVSAAGTFLISHFHLQQRLLSLHPAPVVSPPRVIYGTGLGHFKGSPQEMTCTAMATKADGSQTCTTWSYVMPGQRMQQAAPLPPGTDCSAVEVDQQLGRWACTAP